MQVEILHFKKLQASEMTFFGTFLSKKWQKQQKNKQFLSYFWKILLIVLSNAHFLVLWKHSSKIYGHFGTFTPKNGKTYISPQFWPKFHFLVHVHLHLYNKTLTTFPPFLVLDLQPNLSITQLWYSLCPVKLICFAFWSASSACLHKFVAIIF